MAEAYIIDAVRTAVGKRNGSLAGDTSGRPGRARHGAVCSTGLTSTRLRSTTSSSAASTRIGGQAGNIAATVVAGRRLPRRGARRHGRPAVRVEPAGDFLWRTGDHVRHRGHHRGRRHAEHEPDPDRVGDDGRRAVRVHLADQRVEELAAPLRRPGDLQFRGSELIAEKWNISREEMEQFALTSHQRAFAAIRGGHFENEIIAVGRIRASTRVRARHVAGEDGRPASRWSRAAG